MVEQRPISAATADLSQLAVTGARRRWRARLPAAGGLVVTAAALLVVLLARPSAAWQETEPAGTPCADLSGMLGTPAPGAGGTPPAEIEGASCIRADSFGTPVAVDGLAVTLLADNFRAGPRELTIVVEDADGEPVSDATVTVRTRSLEMDHGVSVDETVELEPGRYFAERVSLGMGGDWLVEITIERAGEEPAVLYVVLTLEGPTHGH